VEKKREKTDFSKTEVWHVGIASRKVIVLFLSIEMGGQRGVGENAL